MEVDPSFAGRRFSLPQPYAVEAPVVRAFARAVGSTHPAHVDEAAARALGYRGIVAPPTFAAVIAQCAEALYVRDPAAGVDFSRVVHADERIRLVRPIQAGDTLAATVEVLSITARAGITQVTTRTDITSTAPRSAAPSRPHGGAPVADGVPPKSAQLRPRFDAAAAHPTPSQPRRTQLNGDIPAADPEFDLSESPPAPDDRSCESPSLVAQVWSTLAVRGGPR